MSRITDENIGLGKGPTASDERLKKKADEGRSSRAVSDRRITEDRENTDYVRASARRNEFLSNILPDPPELPGYKMIWLSTTNNQDTIPERMRRGYAPVKMEDIPGYDSWQIKSGDWTGYVGVREMLLFKIPIKIWEEDMNFLHHQAPLDEERGIKDSISSLKGELGSKGKLIVESGMDELAAPVRNPKWN